jgi:hypothetical protein
MNPNPIGIAAAVLSVAAFALTYTQLRRRALHFRSAAFAALSLLAIPSVLFAIYYLHVLPEWAWFYTLRSWRGSELLVIFLGSAAGAFATLLPRWLLVLPLFFLVVLAIVPYLKPFAGPIADEVFEERWQGNVCLQSTPSTCGPASTSTILRQLGSDPSERAAARAAYSYVGGTEAWYLARYVREKGFLPRFDIRQTFSPDAGLPAVVGVRFGGAGHFIAVLTVDQEKVTFADPLSGEDTVSLSQFQRRYTFTGFHMVISKSP